MQNYEKKSSPPKGEPIFLYYIEHIHLQPEDDEANYPAQQHLGRHVLYIPTKLNVLHLHQGQAADAANRQQATADGRRVSHDTPLGTVGAECSPTQCVERDVGNSDGERVDNRAEHSRQNT